MEPEFQYNVHKHHHWPLSCSSKFIRFYYPCELKHYLFHVLCFSFISLTLFDMLVFLTLKGEMTFTVYFKTPFNPIFLSRLFVTNDV